MKTIYYLFAIGFCCLLNSCLDTEEKVDLKTDGSGVYSISMNMDGVMSQLQTLAQQQGQEMNLGNKDTTLFFKGWVDTATGITEADKALLRDGTVQVHSDEEKDELKITMQVPFKNLTDLGLLKEHLSEIIGKAGFLSNALNVPGMQDENNDMPGGNESTSPSPFQKGYSFSATKNSLSNILTNKKFITDTLATDSSMQILKQMAPLIGDLNYTSTFVLPREAKHYSGNNIKISDDKKTVSFSCTLTDILDKPEVLEYRIDY